MSPGGCRVARLKATSARIAAVCIRLHRAFLWYMLVDAGICWLYAGICSLAGCWSTRVLVIQAISIPGSGLVASSAASSVRLRLASAERIVVSYHEYRYLLFHTILHIFEPMARVLGMAKPPR